MENISVYETPSKETPKIVEDPSVLSPADMQRFPSRLQFYQNAFTELYENMVENTDLSRNFWYMMKLICGWI